MTPITTSPGVALAEPRRSGVVLLCTECRATNVIYHALASLGEVALVVEQPVSRSQLLKGRIRRLGAARVAGQLAFQVGVSPWLTRRGAARYGAVLRAGGLSEAPITGPVPTRVTSVNSPECRDILAELAPTVVVVSGTRIIGRETLRSVAAPFVNLHAGITPAYRGVHGAYWALADGRPDLAGATVHLIDEGIDTGRVIAQARITSTELDSFATYPALQLAAGVPLLMDAVRSLLAGREPTGCVVAATHQSLRYHPTIWDYARTRLMRGVR